MPTNKIKYLYLGLLLASATPSYGKFFDRQSERPTADSRVEVDTAPYEEQVSQLEKGIARLKLQRDADIKDVIRYSDMNFRINYLEVKLDKAKKGVSELKKARNQKQVEEAERKIELQLADVQANLYGAKAE